MSDAPSQSHEGSTLRAVFVSYAREDALPAARIADALRSQGLEVWFDQNELRGGDAWDQKIRRRIKECSVFMPIISANTQSRGEGYFRLEWRLAVERTHLMAEGVPFLAPVVIDATAEAAAIVPAEFLKVQWTRLSGALPTTSFVEQVRRMLEAPAHAPVPAAAPTPTAGVARRSRGLFRVLGGAAVVAVAAGAALVVLRRPPEPAAAAVIPASAPASEAAVDARSIAVLPFENMSVDKDNAFFADGVHEDVLTNLSFVRDLHVVSRTSVMRYRATTKSIREIGRELGVAYVLEGSVRREGNKVRVTGQLINARTDEHVWAKAYDRDLTDIFAIQGELAQSIADALQAVLSPETRALITRRPTENTAAYDDYVKARQVDKAGLGGLDASISLLREAVRLDPSFAAGWSELATRLAFVHFSTDASEQVQNEGKQALDTAIRLAPDDPVVIEAEGDFYYYAYRDYARATEQYVRLAQMRPNDPIVYYSLGLIQRRQGRLTEAAQSLERAFSLDPSNTDTLISLSQTYAGLRRTEQAMANGRKAVKMRPKDVALAYYLGFGSFLLTGSTKEMAQFASMEVNPEDQGSFIYGQRFFAGLRGDWKEYLRLVGLQRYYDGNTDDPRWGQDVTTAEVYAEMGDMDHARERAAEAMVQLKAELARQPENGLLWADYGLDCALLGRKDDALAAAARATQILPESRDSLVGSNISNLNSLTLAWAGEKDRALSEIKRLFHVPWGMSVYAARISYRPLRDDPRFQAMMADPANREPIR